MVQTFQALSVQASNPGLSGRSEVVELEAKVSAKASAFELRQLATEVLVSSCDLIVRARGTNIVKPRRTTEGKCHGCAVRESCHIIDRRLAQACMYL